MSTALRACACMLIVLVMAVLASAGPLTGVNLLVNGEFEDDPAGTPVPNGWVLDTSAPCGWQGVTQYCSTSGHPRQRPDGQGPPAKCYGTFMDWYNTCYGTIEQSVNVGTPGQGPIQVWVAGWVYTGDLAGAYVQFTLEQNATKTLWQSPQIYDLGDGNGWWTWSDYSIPSDFGFVAGQITFRATIQLAEQGPPQVGLHGMFTDGLQLEAQIIPEPGTLILLIPPGVALVVAKRRRGRGVFQVRG